jgi:aminomethyltransferase
MVPFAGWEMPVQYAGVIAEHRAVRSDAGVFDVSHMGELEIEGPTARDLLQSTLSNDVDRLSPGEAQYTLVTTDEGGIVDDVILYRLDEHRYLVVANASNVETVYAWLKERELRGSDVRDVSDEYSLLAVQGPRALERLGLGPAKPFTWAMGEIDGVEVMVNRTGYTGEEGVELACMSEDAVRLWDAVLARGVVPCGLGARDTLRLEVCYPLHGNDIGPQWDAISSGLGWACALDTDFTGVERLRAVKERGPRQRLVPFVMTEKAIPRQGMAVAGGGEVTSGTMSPMLDVGIGLAYVPAERAKAGSEIVIDVRGNDRRGEIRKKPLYRKEQE